MESVTVEFQRYGDPTGTLRLSDKYIRTVGTMGPSEEVSFELPQENLIKAMQALDYDRLLKAGDIDRVKAVAEKALSDLTPYVRKFLGADALVEHNGRLCQVDVVTRVLELAQLPFEILEAAYPDIVITRRIRQPWSGPAVVRKDAPKVLFAWAEPKRRKYSDERMEVPHERQLEKLDELLSDWGGLEGGALVEVENSTVDKLRRHLTVGHGYTHVHLLAHGVGPKSGTEDLTEYIDLHAKPEPKTFLALEDESGEMDCCPPEMLREIFQDGVPRPASFAIATCHSSEIDPIYSGATLAHVLHETGIPVVLASQLALTTVGSDQLISTFLAKVIDGEDPREALRACRDQLRASTEETFYDRVALVGYIHLDEDFEQQLSTRHFKIALARLKAISNDAAAQAERVLVASEGGELEEAADPEEIARRFASVRERLEALERAPARPLTTQEREELHGLQASSLKREAEAAWQLSQIVSNNDKQRWLDRSRDALREAARAYARAAASSRDQHWSWVQWLVLHAVVEGNLRGHEVDWVASRAAATDAAERTITADATDKANNDIAQQAIWARGSLAELSLISCLLPPSTAGVGDDPIAQAAIYLQELVEGCRRVGDTFPISSTLDQLTRYESWWGADSHWNLPENLVKQAKTLSSQLKRFTEELENH